MRCQTDVHRRTDHCGTLARRQERCYRCLANAQTNALHLYDLRQPFSAAADAAASPVIVPKRTWLTRDLFPRMMAAQTIRDVAVVATAAGYELAGIGRVYYNTAPRAHTQINVRALSADRATLGAPREIAVDLPEQEFSGFMKSLRAATDLQAIGSGAYDSGQGSVRGLSYAVQDSAVAWTLYKVGSVVQVFRVVPLGCRDWRERQRCGTSRLCVNRQIDSCDVFLHCGGITEESHGDAEYQEF